VGVEALEREGPRRLPDSSAFGGGGSSGEAFSGYVHQPPTLLPDLPDGEPGGSVLRDTAGCMSPHGTGVVTGGARRPQTQSSQHQSRAPETGGATGKDTI